MEVQIVGMETTRDRRFLSSHTGATGRFLRTLQTCIVLVVASFSLSRCDSLVQKGLHSFQRSQTFSTGGRPASNHGLFLLFRLVKSPYRFCLSLLFFFLAFICWLHGIDFYPPVCCLCEQCTSRAEGKRERDCRPYFSF